MGGAARRRVNRVAAAPAAGGVCSFCGSDVQDESTVGLLYTLETTTVHYYCVLLSCCLVQRGEEEEGLFGFLLNDILTEIQRGKKLRCSYCGAGGANLGCCVGQCRKQFHLPCGRRRGAVSLFYGNYKTFCIAHAPKQAIPEAIMCKARARKARAKQDSRRKSPAKVALKKGTGELQAALGSPLKLIRGESEGSDVAVCVVCYEEVAAWPAPDTFWPPCCGSDSWFHTPCLQRMALSAGVHYFKCPLCNDKETFQNAVASHGVYIPDRDAAWELEEEAYAELYERPRACAAADCRCDRGREYDADVGRWELKLCLTCGSVAAHAGCLDVDGARHICARCVGVAPPADLAALESIPLTPPEAERSASPDRRPLMTHRMSLRRTKPRFACRSVGSAAVARRVSFPAEQVVRPASAQGDVSEVAASSSVPAGRLSLGLRSPRARPADAKPPPDKAALMRELDQRIVSPLKFIEERMYARLRGAGGGGGDDFRRTVDEGVRRMRRPAPLCVKERMIGNILEKILSDCTDDALADVVASSVDDTRQVPSETSVRDTRDRRPKAIPGKDSNQTPLTLHSTLAKADADGKEHSLIVDLTTMEEISTVNNVCHHQTNGSHPMCAEFIENNKDCIIDLTDTNFENSHEYVSEVKRDYAQGDAESIQSFVIFDEEEDKGSVVVSTNSNEENFVIKERKISKAKKKKIYNEGFELPLDDGIPSSPQKSHKEIEDNCKLILDLSTNKKINAEKFKSHYLSELEPSDTKKCNYNHEHSSADHNTSRSRKKTPIDFAIEAAVKCRREMADRTSSESEKGPDSGILVELVQKGLDNNNAKDTAVIHGQEKADNVVCKLDEDTELINGEESGEALLHTTYDVVDNSDGDTKLSPSNLINCKRDDIENEHLDIKRLKRNLKRKLDKNRIGSKKKRKLERSENVSCNEAIGGNTEGEGFVRQKWKNGEDSKKYSKNVDGKIKSQQECHQHKEKSKNTSKTYKHDKKRCEVQGFNETTTAAQFHRKKEKKKKKPKKERKEKRRDKHVWRMKLSKETPTETKVLRQAVLNFSPERKPEVLSTPKPDGGIKRKRIKTEPSPDGLKQTSLTSFFSLHATLT